MRLEDQPQYSGRLLDERFNPNDENSLFVGQSMALMYVLRLEPISPEVAKFCIEQSLEGESRDLAKRVIEAWNMSVEISKEPAFLIQEMTLNNLCLSFAISDSDLQG